MEKVVIDFVTLYGPMSFGWVACVVLYVGQTRERKQWLQEMSTHMNKNTEALTQLITYLKAKMDGS